MPDASIKEALTNTTPKSCVEVNCDCNTIWSLAQQFSTKRLCVESGENRGKLVRHYAVRARRIAATYARFYLELEEGGAPSKLGRYYWMALGAFASKTVACTFEAWQVRSMSMATKTVWEGLGKGNFWLFCDISGWHWYHNMYRDSFEKCVEQRNSENYAKGARDQIKLLPWSCTALPKIDYFKASQQIKAGFQKVKAFEMGAGADELADIQFAHLLEIATHEQKIILQRLIYEDGDFSGWIKLQRSSFARWASPQLELVFTHQCTNRFDEVKSVAPAETHLEEYSSRMDWINKAASKFHKLMQVKQPFMHSALTNMAHWVDMPDRNGWQFDDKS